MYRNVRLRLRSQIGEVRGDLHRISAAEYLAREAAVGGGAGASAAPSSSLTSKAATHATSPVFCATRESAAIHGGAKPRTEVSATPPASKRRKTVVPGTQPPMITHADLILKRLQQQVPEPYYDEPAVLLRARDLKSRYAGIIAKSEETLRIRHRQDLERRPTADMDQAIREAKAEAKKALRQVEERNGRHDRDALRKMAREALQEVEKNGRHTGLCVQTIHPRHLMELGISAVQHVVSPERSRDGALPMNRRPRSPLEQLGLFIKPGDE
jgi:hypothetical protein